MAEQTGPSKDKKVSVPIIQPTQIQVPTPPGVGIGKPPHR